MTWNKVTQNLQPAYTFPFTIVSIGCTIRAFS